VHAERLHERIAGSELGIVEGGEHWMIWDRAEEVAARIEAFVHRSEGERR
jgi:pimeloyl-ACP methyl ester carboxylesterase